MFYSIFDSVANKYLFFGEFDSDSHSTLCFQARMQLIPPEVRPDFFLVHFADWDADLGKVQPLLVPRQVSRGYGAIRPSEGGEKDPLFPPAGGLDCKVTSSKTESQVQRDIKSEKRSAKRLYALANFTFRCLKYLFARHSKPVQ